MKKSSDELEKAKVLHQFRAAAGVSLAVLATGAIFYHYIEDMTWLNAFYFCVITLTTIGYGDIVPTTNPGKLFTIFYVIVGVGIIATFVNLTVKRSIIVHRTKK